jgi:hypothetical protein
MKAVTIIELASAIFFLISGVCWIMAARIVIFPMGGVIGPPPSMFAKKAYNQARWSKFAAWFAAAASFAQVACILLKTISD